eukprot:gene16198-7569_t
MGTVALSERTLLAVKRLKLSKEDNAPSLDDFDREMEVYRVARDEIHAAAESSRVGWITVNMQPVKQTIETYASKWVFTFTKYLTDQVSSALNDLDSFLKRIEPGVEAITGEERDIFSFMRLMRIFNEVTAQQTELDTKFATMKRTLSLLEKYEQKLPETTQKFYAAAPLRWNNLKMKVNQAKQRLGPRIQAEAESVTKTLQKFGERCLQLDYDFRASEAFKRSCRVYAAHNIMDSIEKSLNTIEGEAQDLVELQELLEEEIVDFSILPSLRSDLGILRQVWETAKVIQEQQSDWKRHRWQKIRPKLLRKLLGQQEELLKQLPEKAIGWDVTIGVQQSIERMQSCVPIMEDLSKAAMRTRHWKQLVRATGGAVNISSDGLTKMTLGQFIGLGLQNHADEVRGVIQRAAKDVGIEKALKTYEEVWLSKMFELVKHTRLSTGFSNIMPTHDTPASEYGNDSDHGMISGVRHSGSRVSLASLGLRSDSRLRATSILSFTSKRPSILNIMELGEVLLLKNIEPILEELELHQLSLQSMLGGSAASSFADDIVKWQKTLQNLEAVLNLWWESQQKWIKLDDLYNGNECRVALPKETNFFASSSHEFRQILKLAEKNPNVLQICTREDILPRLEKININFETCLKALTTQLERRKQKFPRLYLMSQEEVLNIVCKGYDPGLVNPYFSKILRNACVMDYEVHDTEERKFYKITGIRSLHGEILKFVKPVDCDSVVENWLNAVVSAVKMTLQVSLASALGMPLPDSIRIGLMSRESTTHGKMESKIKKSPSPQQRKVLFAQEPKVIGDLENTAQLTQKLEKCFEECQAGDKDALPGMQQHLSAILQSAAALLQGSNGNDLDDYVLKQRTKVADDSNTEQVDDDFTVEKDEILHAKQEIRIFLTPSQMQKLTNLIFVLSNKRDLTQKLSKVISSTDQNGNEGMTQLARMFEWQSQLKYYWSQDSATCRISVMDYDCDYGFEYQGTAARIVNTPESEKAVFWMTQSMLNRSPVLLVGSTVSSRNEMLLELSNAFGFPAFQFVCSENLSTKQIGEVFKGIAATGSWGIFANLDRLSNSALSVITQLVARINQSLQAKKSTFTMLDDELSLSCNAKVFACMDLCGEVADNKAPSFFPNITSSLYTVPAGLLAKFRIVCLSTPDIETIVKMHLMVHGFSYNENLAHSLANIYSIWSKLAMVEAAPSVRALCSMVSDAGDHLDQLKALELAETYYEQDPMQDKDREDEDPDSPPLSPTEAAHISNSEKKDNKITNEDEIGEHERSISAQSASSETPKIDLKTLEQKSLLLAIRGHMMPSLLGADAVMFATLLADFFPSLDVPLIFNQGMQEDKHVTSAEKTIGLTNQEKGAPLRILPSSPQPKDQAISDLESAIRIAVQKIDLQPGHAFVSRVLQLSQLVSSNKTVIVVGPAGCGKTEIIRALIAAQREMGRNIIYNSMFLGSVDAKQLFGYFDKNTKVWVDGLLPSVLRRKLHDMYKCEIGLGASDSQDLRWIHLDGPAHPSQLETLADVLTGSDNLTFPDAERLNLPSTVRFIWEVDTLDNIPTSLLLDCGVLKLNSDDIGWELILQNWLSRQTESNRDILTDLCNRYIPTTIDFLIHEKVIRSEEKQKKSVVGYNHSHGQLQHAVSLTETNMVQNLISIFEALIYNAQDPSHDCFDAFFNFAAFWAFGGNLLEEYREHFSNWWRNQWSEFITFPDEVSLWQCYVHPETHEFVYAQNFLPSYSGKPNSSFPPDAHVATSKNMVVSLLVSALIENGKPVLLAGPPGCGKSHIFKDRLQSQSTDMAEIQSLFINANKFITSKTLWQRMDEFLEWKHTKTYVPKGNKRLICLIDDLNHSYANDASIQPACETVRQLLDQNGSFYHGGWKWREVQDVTYLATYNPWTTATTPKLSNRLLNKWIVFHLPFPCIEQNGGPSADKLMDLVHRLISSLQIINGNIEGEVNLPLPSIEVLSEAAAYSHRKLVNSLKLEPESEIARRHGKEPGPLCEAEVWANHFEKIRRINEQLCSPVVVNILMNLEEANSTYAQSFHNVKREISKAEREADENLQFLSTMTHWFESLSYSILASDMMPNFAPLMHTLFLVWQHSRFFHKGSNLTRMLRMISNQVVKRARDLLDFSVLDDLISAHSNLKEALQICASFRGRYLDTKDKADALNQQKLAEQIGTRYLFRQTEIDSMPLTLSDRNLQSSSQEESEEIVSSEMIRKRVNEEAMTRLLERVVAITVEVQENIRNMFLPTPQRAHYIFTLNDLCILFRNLCLVLNSSCSQEDLITSWKHECENVYGTVLMDAVDKGRWMQAFHTAAKKRFDKSQLEFMMKPSCLISNLIDVDDGIKKGSKSSKNSVDAEEQINAYKASSDLSKAKAILEHNIHEYNKDNPKVKIYLYEETIRTICRLIRILQSPHECGHAMVLANGFPGLPLPLVKISAYICGFTVFQIHPSSLVLGDKYTIEHFKLDIVNAYTTAGLKGEKLLFVLNEMELFDEDFLVYVTEFLVSNSISHLFNDEEQTSITNAIRTEVTQAGLNYTKETAWNFFLKAVRENLRFVFIVSSMEEKFQNRCRQFPSMINAMQMLSLPFWTKEELVGIASYHLKETTIFDETEKENIAYLLASMHLAVAESDGSERINGKFKHVTNTTFERFVEHFVDMAFKRHSEIEKEFDLMTKTLEAIDRGTELANQLKSQLDHENMVFDQKKQGNFTLLSQIGQDKAITEEQVRLVKKQQWKIEQLERLLPRYQDAHERAVFKAAAMVKETKQILLELDQQGLSDLRSMQKPDSDIEDILAAIIIIVKSPTSDLTWNKGAKRIMANLERFREELTAFDETELTEDTLQVVEPYIKRSHFAPGYMEKKTSNQALESLVAWVCGVVKYHRMMLSRVKPLHKMVQQTTTSLDEAVEKLDGMQSKLGNLNNRMVSLSGKFEDASVDKSRQGLLTDNQQHQLSRAAYFEKLLFAGRQQWTRVLESIAHRRQSMVGNVAISVGFATYLGFYDHEFRKTMTELKWPACLKERGIVIDIKIADNLTVDITLSMASMDTKAFVKNLEEGAGSNEAVAENVAAADNMQDGESMDVKEPAAEEKQSEMPGVEQDNKVADDVASLKSSESERKKQLKEVESMLSTGGNSLYMYDQFLLAVLKLLTGDTLERMWISKGLNYRQLEDASILFASVQTPVLLMDPYNLAMGLFSIIDTNVVTLDFMQRADVVLDAIERAVTSGDTLLVYNVSGHIDSFFFPIIDHINTKCRQHLLDEPSVIKMNGRRLMIHPSFQLIIAHNSPFPNIPDQLASTMTVIDLRPHTNGILRYFLLQGIQRLKPEIHNADNKVYYELFQCYDTLEKLDSTSMALIRGKEGSGMWEETETITSLVKKRAKMASRFSQVILALQRLQSHRVKFMPLAQCVLSAFNVLLSLSALRDEYQFPFDFLVSVFDSATERDAAEVDTRMVYLAENERSNATRFRSRRDKEEKSLKSTAELLGVNLDRIQTALKQEGKGFAHLKGTKSSHQSASSFDIDGSIDLPEEMDINVPDVVEGIDEEIRETCRKFFKNFYKRVSKTLTSDHLELFTLLCWIRMESVQLSPPDLNTVKLLLQKDEFKMDASAMPDKPKWLPTDQWKLLIAISYSEPLLEGIIKSFGRSPDAWLKWYSSRVPEDEDMPEETPAPEPGNAEEDDAALASENADVNNTFESNSKFTKLLLIRCLRPDRFQSAMTKLCYSDLTDIQEKPTFLFDDLFPVASKAMPVLILMPSSKGCNERNIGDKASCPETVFSALAAKAEENSTRLMRVSLSDANERHVEFRLNNAMSADDWILVENLHLGNETWLHHLTRRLLRLHEQSDEDKKWKIFMTSEPSSQLPVQLLYISEKISFDALLSMTKSSEDQSSLLLTNIKNSFAYVDGAVWVESRDKSLSHRNLLYSLCIAHGLITAREVYSPRTVSIKPRVMARDLVVAVQFVTVYFESKQEHVNLSLQEVCQLICEDVYCSKAVAETDRYYYQAIFNNIATGLSSNLGSSIQFGEWSVPVPPVNVDPVDYCQWCIEKLKVEEDCTLKGLQLHKTVGRQMEKQRSDDFSADLKMLCDESLQEPFSKMPCLHNAAKAVHLRHAIDLCKEKLPCLLKIDDYFGRTFSQIRSNPELRSLTPFSEKSLRISQNQELPPTIGYCLLKECEWLNNLLYSISSTLQDLDQRLISGIHAVHLGQASIVDSLCAGRVPREWYSFFPGTSLQTLDGIQKVHSQLNAWLKSGIVPKPSAEPTIGHGTLDVVDLSLLRNPEGLITAMRYSKSMSDGVSIDEITLTCYFSNIVNKRPALPDSIKAMDGIFLTNLFLDGASWDIENSYLAEQRKIIEKMPYVFVTPQKKGNVDNSPCFQCPVFLNRCRQKLLFELSLPIKDQNQNEKCTFNGTCMMLDPSPEIV